MGKGDKKTRRGKIYAGSHGNVRPHSPKTKAAVGSTHVSRPAVHAAPKAPRPVKAPVRKPAVKKAAPRKSS